MSNQPSQEQLIQELSRVQQINFNRSRMRLGEIIDAIDSTCFAAEQGDAGAKQELKQLLAILERAKSASVGVIHGGNGPMPK